MMNNKRILSRRIGTCAVMVLAVSTCRVTGFHVALSPPKSLLVDTISDIPPGPVSKLWATSSGDEVLPIVPTAPILDDVPSKFQPLLASIVNATLVRGADTSNQGHDSFRYEWGTWIGEDKVEHLMDQVDTVRLTRKGYDYLQQLQGDEDATEHTRYYLAGAQDWDCFLHVLPAGTQVSGRQWSGSWTILKALTGLAEIQALTESGDRVKTKRELQGGSDGSLAGGYSSQGDDCVKYVGGPLRAYVGKFGKTTLLEIILRPPIGRWDEARPKEMDENVLEIDEWEEVLTIADPISEKRGLNDNVDEEGEVQTGADTAKEQLLLTSKIGVNFDQVGGLDDQLNAIARRVLASRANPAAAKRLGVSHVRGILLSGPPGTGKTLLARELSRLLGAREPQIVNGPEILDKFIGEAEKKVRELFAPAEREYQAAGDDSALHIIILDEMDAIARKRGTMNSDTTGVRDSVVNQLLAKMDGVRQAPNILVVGLTNRPELLDPALLRPGRLEVQLRIELPDLLGRRDILRIHTRQMKASGGLSEDAVALIESEDETGIPFRTEHYTGAELAGLVRSAASFALARAMDNDELGEEGGMIIGEDLEQALKEVRPALGKQDEVLKVRYSLGICAFSHAMERVMRDLQRFTSPIQSQSPHVQSLLLVGSGGSGGAGCTALAAWAASEASSQNHADYVRFVTALDVLADGSGSEEGRAAALVERFAEAREMSDSLLVLDDVDTLCSGTSVEGYSSVMIATLRALLRQPPASALTAKAGGHSESKRSKSGAKVLKILATTSRTDVACSVLHEIFDETVVVPLVKDQESVERILTECLSDTVMNPKQMAETFQKQLLQSDDNGIACKTLIRLSERAVTAASLYDGLPRDPEDENMPEGVLSNISNAPADDTGERQVQALSDILKDLAADEVMTEGLCEVL